MNIRIFTNIGLISFLRYENRLLSFLNLVISQVLLSYNLVFMIKGVYCKISFELDWWLHIRKWGLHVESGTTKNKCLVKARKFAGLQKWGPKLPSPPSCTVPVPVLSEPGWLTIKLNAILKILLGIMRHHIYCT